MLPLPRASATNEAAEAVLTRNALHQLPDFWKVLALARIASLLRPGGVLRLHDLIFDCQPAETGAVLGAWFAGAARDPALGYTRDDFAEHLRALAAGRLPAERRHPSSPFMRS